MPNDQELLAAIDGEWIAAEAERLVEIPSVTLHEEDGTMRHQTTTAITGGSDDGLQAAESFDMGRHDVRGQSGLAGLQPEIPSSGRFRDRQRPLGPSLAVADHHRPRLCRPGEVE